MFPNTLGAAGGLLWAAMSLAAHHRAGAESLAKTLSLYLILSSIGGVIVVVAAVLRLIHVRKSLSQFLLCVVLIPLGPFLASLQSQIFILKNPPRTNQMPGIAPAAASERANSGVPPRPYESYALTAGEIAYDPETTCEWSRLLLPRPERPFR